MLMASSRPLIQFTYWSRVPQLEVTEGSIVMIEFKMSSSPSTKKDKDKEFEQLISDLKDVYYNSGGQDGGHCFRFLAVRAPASSMAGFLVEMQKPLEDFAKAKKEVSGLEILDRIFIPQVAGTVGPKTDQMTINRSSPGK